MTAALLLQTIQSAVDQNLLDIGYRIAFVGMLTVFSGLVILSFSLPLIRRMAEGRKKETTAVSGAGPDELSREEIAAITTAIHIHLTRISRLEDMKLTWEMYEKPYTPWRLAGRAKILTDRASFRHRNRSR